MYKKHIILLFIKKICISHIENFYKIFLTTEKNFIFFQINKLIYFLIKYIIF